MYGLCWNTEVTSREKNPICCELPLIYYAVKL
jgi:hypothetical protein